MQCATVLQWFNSVCYNSTMQCATVLQCYSSTIHCYSAIVLQYYSATVLQLNYSAQCNGWSWGNSYHSRRQSDRHYHRHCPQPLSLASSAFSSLYWWEQGFIPPLVDWFQNQSKCDNLESTLFGNPVYVKEILSLFGHLLNAGTTCGFSFQCNILLELAEIFSNVNWNTIFYTFLGRLSGNLFSVQQTFGAHPVAEIFSSEMSRSFSTLHKLHSLLLDWYRESIMEAGWLGGCIISP